MIHSSSADPRHRTPTQPTQCEIIEQSMTHHCNPAISALSQSLFSPALQRAVQGAITIHDDEAEALVILEQLIQCLGVEFIVAKIQRSVDGLERLEIQVHLLFFALVRYDRPAVYN